MAIKPSRAALTKKTKAAKARDTKRKAAPYPIFNGTKAKPKKKASKMPAAKRNPVASHKDAALAACRSVVAGVAASIRRGDKVAMRQAHVSYAQGYVTACKNHGLISAAKGAEFVAAIEFILVNG